MAKIDVLNAAGKKSGSRDLSRRWTRMLVPECLDRRQLTYSEQFLSPSQASSPVLRS